MIFPTEAGDELERVLAGRGRRARSLMVLVALALAAAAVLAMGKP